MTAAFDRNAFLMKSTYFDRDQVKGLRNSITKRHVKSHLFMTQLAAGFAAKGLLNLITSSPVATGLAF